MWVAIALIFIGAAVVLVFLHRNLIRLRNEADAARTKLDAALAARETGEPDAPSDYDVTQLIRMYNNCVTLYGNAIVTFPTNLFSRRLGFEPYEKYRSDDPALAEHVENAMVVAESTKVMHPFTLWCVGMCDASFEEGDPIAPAAASPAGKKKQAQA